VLVGTNWSREPARALARGIPGARLDLIDGVGHVLQLRAPAALARVVIDTVARARTP